MMMPSECLPFGVRCVGLGNGKGNARRIAVDYARQDSARSIDSPDRQSRMTQLISSLDVSGFAAQPEP
jgi:hypothetical protein